MLLEIESLEITDLPSESELISTWGCGHSKPLVSIACTTFNHEKYIESALKGFLSQKTTFPFEIIVHDDASEDKTKSIIHRYQREYPKIIKTIFQRENQYSIGKRPGPIVASDCVGKYIAICEGDDYWINPYKLQIQVTALEDNPDVNICFTKALAVSQCGNIKPIQPREGESSRLFGVKEVVANGGGFMPTATIIYRNISALKNKIACIDSMVGDIIVQIFASSPNGALYLDATTAVYRNLVPGGWTSKQDSRNKIMHRIRMRKVYLDMADVEPSLKKELRNLNNSAVKSLLRYMLLRGKLLSAIRLFKLFIRP